MLKRATLVGLHCVLLSGLFVRSGAATTGEEKRKSYFSGTDTVNLDEFYQTERGQKKESVEENPGFNFRPFPFSNPLLPLPVNSPLFPNWAIRPTSTIYVEVTERETKHPVCWTSYGAKPACLPYFNYRPDDQFQNFQPLIHPAAHTPLPLVQPTRFLHGLNRDVDEVDELDSSEEGLGARDSRDIISYRTPSVSIQEKVLIDARPPTDTPLTYNSNQKLTGIFSGNLLKAITKTISVTKVETYVDSRVTATLIAKNCIPISSKIPYCDVRSKSNVSTTGFKPVVDDASATTGFHPYVPKNANIDAKTGFPADEFQAAQKKFFSDLPVTFREGSLQLGHLNPLQQLIYRKEGLAEGSMHYLMQVAAQQAAYHAYLTKLFYDFAAKQSHSHAANAYALQQAALEAAQHHAHAEQAAHQSISQILEKYGMKNRLSQFFNWVKLDHSVPIGEYENAESESPDAIAEFSENVPEKIDSKPLETITTLSASAEHSEDDYETTTITDSGTTIVKLEKGSEFPSPSASSTNLGSSADYVHHEYTDETPHINHKSTPQYKSKGGKHGSTDKNAQNSSTNAKPGYGVIEPSADENTTTSSSVTQTSNEPNEVVKELTIERKTEYSHSSSTTDYKTSITDKEFTKEHDTWHDLESTTEHKIIDSTHEFSTGHATSEKLDKLVPAGSQDTVLKNSMDHKEIGVLMGPTPDNKIVDNSLEFTTDYTTTVTLYDTTPIYEEAESTHVTSPHQNDNYEHSLAENLESANDSLDHTTHHASSDESEITIVGQITDETESSITMGDRNHFEIINIR